ncbi:MAG: MFS transporter [Pseudomonadota bacterium]
MSAIALTDSQRRKSLAAVIASAFGAGITMGSLLPLLSLLLERQGFDAALIGLNAAMFPLAVLAFGPFAPRLARRFGALPSLLGSAALFCLLTPLYAFTGPWAWFPLRFLAGMSGAVFWMTSEAWINLVTSEARRGRVMAVYSATMAGGFMLGPLVIGLTGIEGLKPFLAICAANLIAAAPLLLARGVSPDFSRQAPMRALAALKHAPTVLAGAAAGGMVDLAVISLLPVWGLAQGFAQSTAAGLLSAFAAGSLLMQWPVGWLADHWSRRGTLLACSAVSGAGAVLLPLLAGEPALLWPMVFVWGGVVFGVYTAALALLGERFPSTELAGANALFIMAYEVGSLSGPPLAGAAMDRVGPMGLPATIVAVAGSFLLFGLARRAMMKG